MVPFREMVYVEQKAQFVPEDEVTPDMTVAASSRARSSGAGCAKASRSRSGSRTRRSSRELRKTHPPKHKQGFTVFFTGLSGSGQVDDRQCAARQAAGDRQRGA